MLNRVCKQLKYVFPPQSHFEYLKLCTAEFRREARGAIGLNTGSFRSEDLIAFRALECTCRRVQMCSSTSSSSEYSCALGTFELVGCSIITLHCRPTLEGETAVMAAVIVDVAVVLVQFILRSERSVTVIAAEVVESLVVLVQCGLHAKGAIPALKVVNGVIMLLNCVVVHKIPSTLSAVWLAMLLISMLLISNSSSGSGLWH